MGTIRYTVDDLHNVTEIHKAVVHRFFLSDVEDPDLYAAHPLYKWEKSEPGQFVMNNAIGQPEWHRQLNHMTYGYDYVILAELEMSKLSEFYLKWGQDGSNKI
jgi:hypothetical protein